MARDSETQFLQVPVAPLPPLAPGQRVGPWRVLSVIGTGGMGVVYLAERADGQFQKRVAIKLVRAGWDADAYRRFRAERSILATLEHDNIARLVDGGTAENGAPYFAMELVEGRPVDEFCNARTLGLRERIELFLDICSAVQYAHQRLILHRDLKPSNILVTEGGVPKLLDFGIATIFNPAGEDPERTLTQRRPMTPQYASPEQVQGLPVTTATDIYSLGVVLYTLLTGRLPYRVTATTEFELAQAICCADPAPAGLDSDLEAILSKALRKDTAERYSSVGEFATDLRAFLMGLPVSARRDDALYRCSKFIRRHKLGLAFAAVLFLVVCIGAAAVLREAQLAERRMRDVRALSSTLLFDVHDAIKDLPGTTPARKLLVEKSLHYLDGVARDSGDDPSLQRQLADAYEKMGDVQGNPDNPNLGDARGALASYRKALSLRSEADAPRFVATQEKAAMCLERLGDVNAALLYLNAARRIAVEYARAPGHSGAPAMLAGLHYQIGVALQQAGDYSGSLANYALAADLREKLQPSTAALDAFNTTRLAGTYGAEATLYSETGDQPKAIAIETRALQIMQALAATAPQNASYRGYVAEAHYWLGVFESKSGQPANARSHFERALSIFSALSAADPADVRSREYVRMCRQALAHF